MLAFAFLATACAQLLELVLSLFINGARSEAFVFVPRWVSLLISIGDSLVPFAAVMFCVFLFLHKKGIKEYGRLCLRFLYLPAAVYFIILAIDIISSLVIFGWMVVSLDTQKLIPWHKTGYVLFASLALTAGAFFQQMIYTPALISAGYGKGYWRSIGIFLRQYKAAFLRITIYIFAAVLFFYAANVYTLGFVTWQPANALLIFILKGLKLFFAVMLPCHIFLKWIGKRLGAK